MRRNLMRIRRPYVLAATLALLSGAVMMLAGYALAEWGWPWALLLATVGGLVILVAFAVSRWDA